MSVAKLIGSSVLLVLSSAAFAYVPPSFFLVRMLARKHVNIDSGTFKSKVTLYKRNGEILASLTESMSLTNSESANIKLYDMNGMEIARRTRKLSASKSGEVSRPLTYDLTLSKDGTSIFDHLKALGLPVKTEAALYSEKDGTLPYKPEVAISLSRLDRTTAIVLGDKAAKADSASIWFEKDSYLPLRAFIPAQGDPGSVSDQIEYRLTGYQPHQNFLYPKVIQVVRNPGAVFAKIETIEFKPGSIKHTEESGHKEDIDSDLKEAVENYFKWVR